MGFGRKNGSGWLGSPLLKCESLLSAVRSLAFSISHGDSQTYVTMRPQGTAEGRRSCRRSVPIKPHQNRGSSALLKGPRTGQ